MGATSRERYAVVSCHVERPLDDAVWARFSALQAARPGGFAVAALMRPADPAFGEYESAWLARAREAARRGPLGHHTHWTAPDHARPTQALVTDCHKEEETPAYDRAGRGEPLVTDRHELPGERVLSEGRRLRELGLEPTLFCGGGWYTDASVAEACAELGYVDCTPRGSRPAYLAEGEPWAGLGMPSRIELPSGRILDALPTTYSLGELMRVLVRPHRRKQMPRRVLPEAGGELPLVVHAYFHDTDLLDQRRRILLHLALRLLARRAHATDLDTLGATAFVEAPRVAWADVARL